MPAHFVLYTFFSIIQLIFCAFVKHAEFFKKVNYQEYLNLIIFTLYGFVSEFLLLFYFYLLRKSKTCIDSIWRLPFWRRQVFFTNCFAFFSISKHFSTLSQKQKLAVSNFKSGSYWTFSFPRIFDIFSEQIFQFLEISWKIIPMFQIFMHIQ